MRELGVYGDEDMGMTEEEEMCDDMWYIGSDCSRPSRGGQGGGLAGFCREVGLSIPSIGAPTGRKEQQGSGCRSGGYGLGAGSGYGSGEVVGMRGGSMTAEDSPLAVECLMGRTRA
jgi:hypothetical protein